ncbi:MAG: hypothetical protein A4E57_03736 [Syntrophorhabdaceae bacterium PtaU1.Bin034]|nr:MAG: hypothetical protein A4E57_03736 [Syntrophorhabdaceae bacterium PtaU1.Bin034]
MNIEVKVIAGARKREMKLEGSRLKVKLISKPIKGKANEELIEFISDTFKVKRREITIVSGEKDTRKIISVPIQEEALRQVIEGQEK